MDARDEVANVSSSSLAERATRSSSPRGAHSLGLLAPVEIASAGASRLVGRTKVPVVSKPKLNEGEEHVATALTNGRIVPNKDGRGARPSATDEDDEDEHDADVLTTGRNVPNKDGRGASPSAINCSDDNPDIARFNSTE